MRSAIIENGVVANVIKGSIPGSIECPPEVGPGWTYAGNEFIKPPVIVESPDYNEQRVQELKTLLTRTDHKVLPDYEPKKNETKSSIKEQRKQWRRELRKLLEDVTS